MKKNSFSDIAGSSFYEIFTAPIIFGKMHFLLILENEFFHEIKSDGITSLHGIHVIQVKPGPMETAANK